LALVAGQDVEPGDRPGRWKIVRGTAKNRVISTVDPETRHAHKTRRSQRDGYKAHVAAEPETGLITGCDIGAGNTGDAEAAPGVEDGFTLDDFAIDLTAMTVTCPAKIAVTISKNRTATFGKRCKACPLRTSCTTAKSGRTITLHEHHQLLAEAHSPTPELPSSRRSTAASPDG
jgi:Transposase DDE domain